MLVREVMVLDYVHPVEALIPGVQGKILGATLRSGEPLTMRGLARLAGVSPNQAALVIDHLDELGLLRRQPAGHSLLVSLVEDNPVISALRQIADLRAITLRMWKERARLLDPAPRCLAVYGSWARGQARTGSDVDVLVVLPADLRTSLEDEYAEQIANWCAYAGRVAGLPVSALVLNSSEAQSVDGPLWDNIRHEAVVVAGTDPRQVLRVA